MKKTLALVLALCLVLAAFPVFAEDFSGTWYMNSFGLTAGSVELKEDGTCVLNGTSDGEPTVLEGTWTAEETTVKITAQGKSLVLNYADGVLVPDLEAAAALSGQDLTGLDAAVISALISFTREPSDVTMADLQAYQADGTVPEGKTKEDMDALVTQMQANFLTLASTMVSAGSSGESAVEVTVLEDNFFVRDTYFGQEGVYIARIQNDTESPIVVTSYDSSMTLKDADGNVVGEDNFMSTTGSLYLEPGEISFVSFVVDVNEGATVASFETNIKAEPATYQTPDTAIDVDAIELRTVEEYSSTAYYGAATVTNKGESAQSGISVIIAVRDQDGKLIELISAGTYNLELAAGSTITLVDNMNANTIEYCTANELVPTSVEAIAWIN